MLITVADLRKIAGPAAKEVIITEVVNFINEDGDRYKIDTPRRVAEFVGQGVVESGNYSILEENLNYSAKRMTQVWPKRFPNVKAAEPYAKNPKALANFTYGSRMGNRPGTNDGWDYRGRGIKQLTGRENYTEFTKWAKSKYPDAPDFVKYPDKVKEFPWAVLSAVWFWYTKGVYKFADNDDTTGATKAINGGTIGLAERIAAVNKAKRIINPAPTSIKVEKKPKAADPVLKEYQIKLNSIGKYKDIKEINVGKTDGWHGDKTEAAVKAFQEYTGTLEETGELDAATMEAIDNVIAVIETGKASSISEDLKAVKPKVVVDEVPVAVPTKLAESVDKPLIENKTLWTYATSAVGAIGLYWEKGLNFFTTMSPTIQIGLLIILAIVIILGYLSIRDTLRSKKGFKELKQNIAEARSDADLEE